MLLSDANYPTRFKDQLLTQTLPLPLVTQIEVDEVHAYALRNVKPGKESMLKLWGYWESTFYLSDGRLSYSERQEVLWQ